MTIVIVEDGGVLITESEKSLQEFLQKEHFIHYVCMAARPGLSECITLLEHRNYKPGTPRNDLFIMRMIEWCGLMWIAVSIPLEEKNLMEAAVSESGLRVADGIPVMLIDDDVIHFPMRSNTVFTLENPHGHPVYRNDHDIDNAMRDGELQTIERIRKKFS